MAATPSHDWSACPEGELTGLAHNLRSRRRRRRAAYAATFAGMVGLIFAGYLLATSAPGRRDGLGGPALAAPLSCRDVVEAYQAYAAGKLDADLAGRVRAHLDRCPSCREHLGVPDTGSSRREPLRPERFRPERFRPEPLRPEPLRRPAPEHSSPGVEIALR